jgi:nitric oxide synthase-interacting protein
MSLNLWFVSSMKNLIPVKFTLYTPSSSSSASTSTPTEESKAKKEDPEPMCPSCKKRLSNSTLLFRTLPAPFFPHSQMNTHQREIVCKPCGHVTCKTCTDTLVRPSKQCIVCDVKLKDKDVIELKREGMPCYNFFIGRILKLKSHRNWLCGWRFGRNV